MGRAFIIFLSIAWLVASAPTRAIAQAAGTAPATANSGQVVDGVAVRIEDDILTESEVTELSAFQQLVDGRPKSREEIIRELSDQWIVRSEADAAKYPEPSPEDIQNAYSQLASQFSSVAEFKNRCAAAGLSEAAVRRLLAQQLYLSRFLDYRFRPAAEVSDSEVQAYYNNEFVPQLKARNQPLPPLDDVSDTIREVLIQRAITDRAKGWLDESRERLKIDIMSSGDHQ
jgi:hypothetical protein